MFPALPPYSFSRPDLLFLLGVLPFFWLWQWRAFRTLASFLSLFLHSIVFACVVFAAAGLHTFQPGAASIPLLVIDLSQSLTATQRQWMHDTIIQQVRPTADTPTIVFAGTHQQMRWQEAEALLSSPPPALQLTETNLTGALTALLQEEKNRQVYLFSDGWEVGPETVSTDPEDTARVTNEKIQLLVPLLKGHQVKLYPFLPPAAEAVPNVRLQRFDLPQSSASGESVLLSVALENTNPEPVRGELTVSKKDKEVWRQTVTLPPGTSLFTHPLVFSADDSGLIPLRATFTPATPSEDAVTQDNHATAWITVTAKEKILLLSARAQDNRYLERVLSNRGLGVTAINIADQPVTVPPPTSFKSLILNNVARNRLPPALLTGLDDYVRQGGGLIMIGGEESLGLGGYKGTEVEQVLPVTLVPPQKKEEPRTAVILVIDTSGSMRRESKLLYAKEGARAVARNLKDNDYFGVIGFDTEPFVVIPLSLMSTIREDVDSRLNRLKASGGTYLFPALEEAKRQIERQSATRKHIIIITDGETGGSGSAYIDLVSAMNREGKIVISAIAVGEEPNLRLLSRVADYGGGAFHHTTDPTTLPDLFIDEIREKKKPEEKTMVEKELLPIPNPESPFVKDLANRSFPPLKGYVETQVKPGARTDVSLRVDGKRPPLAASWSYGRGKAMAFTSDANGRWSAPWVSWEGFGKFWSQVLQWSLPEAKPQAESHFSATLGHTDTGLVVDLFSYGTSEEGRAAFARVQGPGETKTAFSLQRLAPGHYQGTYQTGKAGDYRVEVTLPSGERLGPLGYTLPPPHIAEVPQPQSNLPLLETLARETDGALNPDVSSLVHPVAPPEPHPLLPYLIPLAMALYFLELLVRRTGAGG